MKTRTIAFIVIFLFTALFVYTEEKKEYNLDEIIHIGLKNNPHLLAKLRETEAKKAAYQASKRLTNPEFEFHTGSAKSYDGLTQINTQGFSISQNIENPIKRHYRIQIFEKGWRALEHRYAFLTLEVIFKIKDLYYKILLMKEKEDLSRKNLDSIEKIHDLIKKRVQWGEVKELEAIKLHVEALKAQNELNRVQADLRLTKEYLNKYLANSLPQDFSVTGKLDYLSLTLEDDALLNKAFLSYPLIKEKEKELELAKNNLSYNKWKILPDFKLSGFINEELDGRNKGFGISFDIPLWNFRSKEIAEAENLMFKSSEELKALKMEIATEIKSKLNQFRLSDQTIRIFHDGLLKLAEQSIEISEVSYTQGEISLVDYLDSQRTYYSIMGDYLDSLYSWNTDKAALEKAIGEEFK